MYYLSLMSESNGDCLGGVFKERLAERENSSFKAEVKLHCRVLKN